MTALPLLLLDVDGVLCPLGEGNGEEMVEFSGGYGGRFALALPARLATLKEAFALIWATSWQQDANDVLCPLFDLPPLPIVDLQDVSFGVGKTWKRAAIERYVRDRPFAWLDDEIGRDAHRWARRRSAPTLLLDVRPDWGLTQDHVDTLLRFATSIAGSAREAT